MDIQCIQGDCCWVWFWLWFAIRSQRKSWEAHRKAKSTENKLNTNNSKKNDIDNGDEDDVRREEEKWRKKKSKDDKCIRFQMAFIINLCAWIWKCIVHVKEIKCTNGMAYTRERNQNGQQSTTERCEHVYEHRKESNYFLQSFLFRCCSHFFHLTLLCFVLYQ